MLLYLHDLLAALALPLWSLSIAQLPTGWAKKARPQTDVYNSGKSKTIYKIFNRTIPWQIRSKLVIKMPPILAYVATLPCETLMLENE